MEDGSYVPGPGMRRWLEVHPPGHPQVQHQLLPPVQHDAEELAPASHLTDTPPPEFFLDKVGCLWPGQAWVVDHDALERPPRQRRVELAANRLDLGELRQRRVQGCDRTGR